MEESIDLNRASGASDPQAWLDQLNRRLAGRRKELLAHVNSAMDVRSREPFITSYGATELAEAASLV